MTFDCLDNESLSTYRLRQWTTTHQYHTVTIPKPGKTLSNGTSFSQKDWVALNYARAKIGRTGDNLLRWGLSENAQCPCGEPIRSMDHIIQGCLGGQGYSDEDFLEANQLLWSGYCGGVISYNDGVTSSSLCVKSNQVWIWYCKTMLQWKVQLLEGCFIFCASQGDEDCINPNPITAIRRIEQEDYGSRSVIFHAIVLQL